MQNAITEQLQQEIAALSVITHLLAPKIALNVAYKLSIAMKQSTASKEEQYNFIRTLGIMLDKLPPMDELGELEVMLKGRLSEFVLKGYL
ncbi:hypothetical protein [Ewingella americana]|uniref:Uncharacterized protein n=1 Tax=Ewingella americana TaxID=41202 RepID=A0A502GC94_9GAMM|nr:hypothetical protein [Ewingella americana]TPG59887.1 hypothetical protein EAH77_15080 [Ewingella americana]